MGPPAKQSNAPQPAFGWSGKPSTEGMNLTLPARMGICPESPLGRTLFDHGTRPTRFVNAGEGEFGVSLRFNASTGDLSKEMQRRSKDFKSLLCRTQDVNASSLNHHTRVAHVADLPNRLEHKEALVRLRAISDLGLMGPGGGAYAPFVSEGLEDKDAAVRRRAVWTLKRMSMPVIQPHLHTVAQKLRHKEAHTRELAAHLLGSMSYGADPFAYQLSVCLRDSNVRVKQEAIQALANMSRAGALPYVKDLGLCLKDEDATMRRLACTTLGKIGKPAASCTDSIVPLLRDKDFRVRQAAVAALADIRRL